MVLKMKSVSPTGGCPAAWVKNWLGFVRVGAVAARQSCRCRLPTWRLRTRRWRAGTVTASPQSRRHETATTTPEIPALLLIESPSALLPCRMPPRVLGAPLPTVIPADCRNQSPPGRCLAPPWRFEQAGILNGSRFLCSCLPFWALKLRLEKDGLGAEIARVDQEAALAAHHRQHELAHRHVGNGGKTVLIRPFLAADHPAQPHLHLALEVGQQVRQFVVRGDQVDRPGEFVVEQRRLRPRVAVDRAGRAVRARRAGRGCRSCGCGPVRGTPSAAG